MRLVDTARLAMGAVIAHRSRSLLTSLGIAVGIAAVVLLTSIGEGVHRFVLQEFSQFGTNIIAVTPGKTETFWISGAQISNVRPLSLDDSVALERLEHVVAVMPVVQGNAQVEFDGRTRRTMILGVGSELPQVWSMDVSLGRFFPPDDQRAPRAFVILGAKVRNELFGERNPLGQRLGVGGDRYRVIGVMEAKGQFLGFDLDDAVYVPAGKALELFNRESLMEIDLVYRAGSSADTVRAGIERILSARHGSEDFTVTTQQQMLDVLGSVLDVLTFAVAALGGISLFVGGVGILTIMTIAVRERRAEVGLLRRPRCPPRSGAAPVLVRVAATVRRRRSRRTCSRSWTRSDHHGLRAVVARAPIVGVRIPCGNAGCASWSHRRRSSGTPRSPTAASGCPARRSRSPLTHGNIESRRLAARMPIQQRRWSRS